MGSIGPGMVMGVLLGGLLGVVAGISGLASGKASTGAKAALALPSALGGGLLGVAVGFFAGLLIDILLVSLTMANIFGAADRADQLPLHRAACANNVARVRTLLANPLDSPTVNKLGHIVFDCTLSVKAKARPDDEMFKILLPVLYAQYVAAPARARAQQEPFKGPDYCMVLDTLIGDLERGKLRAVKSMGLPLHCRDGPSHMDLEQFIRNLGNYHLRGAKFDEVLLLIGGKDGPLGQVRSRIGVSFLDSVVKRHDPVFIIAALEAGIDPGRPESGSDMPAVLEWHIRKFDRSAKFGSGQKALEARDIAAVDRLMRPPTPAEFAYHYSNSSFRRSILRDFNRFERQDDGGAAYFRDLRKLGVDLGLTTGGRDNGRRGILGHNKHTAPALLAELKRLSPAELERMACPRHSVTGAEGEPLLQSASAEGNTVLVDFLHRRGIGDCRPAAGAAAAS